MANENLVFVVPAIIILGCLNRMPPFLPTSLLTLSFSFLTLSKYLIYNYRNALYKQTEISYSITKLTQIPLPPSLSQIHIQTFTIYKYIKLDQNQMAESGFEGFEKRLELHFSGDDPITGLRQIDFETLEEILNAVQCTVVSSVGNHYFDSYVLSESSLFVYPTKIIIKTCGTTQLLKSVRPFLDYACTIGLSLSRCMYTRGNFIFPNAQPYPHTSFKDEVVYLEKILPEDLFYKKASVMPSKLSSHAWHVFSAVGQSYLIDNAHNHGQLFTIEVCMTELDCLLAKKFFRRQNDGKTSDAAGKAITLITGICDINPNAHICDFAFDPCGYSMNGLDGDRYSTIHVTPEDGFSYASFECVGSFYDDCRKISEVLKKVVQVFRPGTMSVSTTSTSHEMWTRVANAVEQQGMKCRIRSVDEFPAAGGVVFQTFTTRRK